MKPVKFGPVTRSPDNPKFYRMPDSNAHFFTRLGAGKNGGTRRYGRKSLIAYLMLSIEEWHKHHPGHPLPIGDLAESDGSHLKDHKTHDHGLAVDVYNLHLKGGFQKGPAYRRKGPQDPAYARALMTELAMQMVGRKNVFRMQWIYHNDPQLRDTVNKAFPAWPRITEKSNHLDHLHVSLHPKIALTEDQLDAILGPDKLKKQVEAAIEELIRSAQMLRFGAQGALVIALQFAMNVIAETQKSRHSQLVLDGKFGPKTHVRVQEFQSLNHLGADGIVGPKTKGAIARRA
ncbi:MAG: peptidoglycan-binding domain-containing protein [Erythrobacter sp.]|nr:peptidoglycan-binding domain-containing protein [Erythrobacter sp.]